MRIEYIELPLLTLFNRLREHGLPLGIDEYLLVLRALQGGFGIDNRRDIEQLCCTLWTKSDDEIDLVHRLFEQIIPIREPLPEISNTLSHQNLAESSLSITSKTSTTKKMLHLNLLIENEESTQDIRTSLRKISEAWEKKRQYYSLVNEYFPVTRRQMKQSWRHLRYLIREGIPEELDVVATVDKIGREGVFLEPVLLPLYTNQAQLMLLIDQDGSMVPFHALSRQLIETAQRGGRLEMSNIYYFHDYPDMYLYHDTAFLEPLPIAEIMEFNGNRSAVLIISDAGAARGNFDKKRITKTEDFIKELRRFVRYQAWLNPMPRARWEGTSADEIARYVPMFEMSRHGLDTAISILRGRYIY